MVRARGLLGPPPKGTDHMCQCMRHRGRGNSEESEGPFLFLLRPGESPVQGPSVSPDSETTKGTAIKLGNAKGRHSRWESPPS